MPAHERDAILAEAAEQAVADYPTKAEAIHRYRIVLTWSEADEAYLAHVPELPGCRADGATYAEALANVETVMQEWVETAKELGRAVPQPA
ncbi:MAG: type II toxin-antitoxin system HicB family antitoxin [Gemmataceae bacterium]|nr:type II toxin-antitoxin system HicB family antitoxin [Gemmataceae bacterium]